MPLEAAPGSRDELLASFLASPAPRTVPNELAKAANRQAPSLALALMGGVFLAFGLAFGWAFVPWNIGEDWALNSSDTASAPAKVVSADRTNLSLNKRRVYRYEFTFTTPAGGRMRGACYTTGSRWGAGDSAVAQYRPDRPALCRLAGARRTEGDASSFFVLLFPAIGAALVLWAVGARRGLRRLLERGEVAEARVIGVEATNLRVNKQTVYRILLQRTDNPGGPALSLRRHQTNIVDFARQRRDSHQPVFILCHPAKPGDILLPETLI